MPTKKEEKETLELFLNQIKTNTHLCTYLNVWFCAVVKSKAGISRSCKVQATKKKEKKR